MQAALTLYQALHPLAGNGYQFWSGIASDFGEATIVTAVVGGIVTHYRSINCMAPRCWRIGHFRTADGHHRLCRVCHPELRNKRLSLPEIHALHYAAKGVQDGSSR
jgi:hypothetical protein